MAPTATCLRGALVVAVFIVLLHSSMAQQPTPSATPDCSNQCTANCTQRCQSLNSDPSNCNSMIRIYGVQYAPWDHVPVRCRCGSSCASSCCESCTTAAQHVTYSCTTTAERVKQYCMPNCMNDCVTYNCASGSPAPPTA
ncbi:hypothetical protein PVAP13_3NG095300 [Panicum virgatum]|uniref:Uncharacterized protein n=1 Tax=Panicum virgatum TaxID=38727 RepID=A0A8T0UEI5_PANVG|nr:hypothetical protein PVAP13_3NG095300 [Panicum virgatum]